MTPPTLWCSAYVLTGSEPSGSLPQPLGKMPVCATRTRTANRKCYGKTTWGKREEGAVGIYKGDSEGKGIVGEISEL